LRRTPAIQLGSAFAAYDATDFTLADSVLTHLGNCAAQFPHNTALHLGNASRAAVVGVRFDMGCQSVAVMSSSRVFIADCAFNEVDTYPGVHSSNGGFEFAIQVRATCPPCSPLVLLAPRPRTPGGVRLLHAVSFLASLRATLQEPPHVAELHYFGNNSYEGNARAFNRWESFTSDGGADSFYNETALSQTLRPDGTATLELAGALAQSEFFCALRFVLCDGG